MKIGRKVNWSATRPVVDLRRHSSGSWVGTVATSDGMVAVDWWCGGSFLSTVVGGRYISWRLDKDYSRRYLITACRRFAAEVAA